MNVDEGNILCYASFLNVSGYACHKLMIRKKYAIAIYDTHFEIQKKNLKVMFYCMLRTQMVSYKYTKRMPFTVHPHALFWSLP